MDIHEKLEKQEIRDFISKQYVIFKSEENAYMQKISELIRKNNPNILNLDEYISYLEDDIKLKNHLKNILKNLKALDTIILSLNWKKFDISSLNINRIDGEKFYRPFIGNQTEYENFKNNL